MRLKKLTPALVQGKRVLHRVELNVKFHARRGRRVVLDDARLRAILPTLRFLRKQRARVILLTWAGRPEGRYRPELTLDPVADRLGRLLRKTVQKVDDCVGPDVEAAVRALKPGDVLLLENVRFHPEEKKRDVRFARAFTRFADVWVMDAFGQAHRDTATVSVAQRFFPKRAAGFLLAREVEELDRAMHKPRHPYVVVIGGAKTETKLPVIVNLLTHADAVLVGGAIANTLLMAKGLQVGKSLVEEEMISAARRLNLTDPRLHLPIDVIVQHTKTQRVVCRAVGAVGMHERILDIGPDTVTLFRSVLGQARMVLWNGPLGFFEDPRFAKGTNAIARTVGTLPAYTILGGGETITAIRSARAEKKMDFISTGGGAMLEFLTGKILPGIKPLIV